MGMLEEGTGGDRNRQCDPRQPAATHIKEEGIWGIHIQADELECGASFYFYSVQLALEHLVHDERSLALLCGRGHLFTQCRLFKGTLRLDKLWVSSPIMTGRLFRLPGESSPPSGNVVYIVCGCSVLVHCANRVWGGEGWPVSFPAFSFRGRSLRIS